MTTVQSAIEDAIREAAGGGSVNNLRGGDLREFALHALAAATEARAESQRWVDWMADEARAAGASWQQIADAHGVSRQWAHKRFG